MPLSAAAVGCVSGSAARRSSRTCAPIARSGSATRSIGRRRRRRVAGQRGREGPSRQHARAACAASIPSCRPAAGPGAAPASGPRPGRRRRPRRASTSTPRRRQAAQGGRAVGGGRRSCRCGSRPGPARPGWRDGGRRTCRRRDGSGRESWGHAARRSRRGDGTIPASLRGPPTPDDERRRRAGEAGHRQPTGHARRWCRPCSPTSPASSGSTRNPSTT